MKLTAEDGSVRHVLNIDKYLPGGHRHPRRHRGILAITFTNKATAEMKARIVQNLNELAREPEGKKDNGYVPSLLALYGCSRRELADAAALAVKELLCDYSQFNISTIDSFFQGVLRVFAREVNHQGDYSVQLDDADAVGAGIGMMLDDINNGSHPSAAHLKRWIDTLMARKISDVSRFNVFDADSSLRSGLRKFVEKMCGEVFRRHAAEMEAYLSTDKVRRLGLAFAKELDSRLPEEARKLAESFVRTMEQYGVEPAQMKNNFGALTECLAKGELPDDKMAGLRAPAGFLKWLELDNPDSTVERDKLFTKSRLPKDGRNPIYPDEAFIAEGARFAAGVRELYVRHKIVSACLTACYNLEFLGYASHYIDIYRRENNLILLSDTNELLRRIIKESDLPFIYERIGTIVTNLLIDEFQDTSVMQWENLRPLVSQSLSQGYDNLIIGDVKQAIYRFRNSDSSMLDSGVQAQFPKLHEVRGNVPAENTNYRSAHAVVRFNNTMFRLLSQQIGVPGYEGVCQALAPNTAKQPGYVRLDFLSTAGATAAETDALSFRRMAQDILRQHAEGYDWKDIAVLVREASTGVALVAQIMEEFPEIPFISDEALLLDRSPAVQLILSMLRIVDEAYAFAGDSQREIQERRYATQREINMMISRFNFYLGDGVEAEEALRKAIEDSPEEAEKIHIDVDDVIRRRPANPAALVETIVATRLGEDIRRREYIYIASFQDAMERFFATNEGGVKAFLAWWDEHKDKLAIASPPDIDAVSVMTIHKSKGLEWACVHIPDCSWELFRPDPQIWYDISPVLKAWMPECIGLEPPMLLVKSSAAFGLEGSPLAPAYRKDIAEQSADGLNTTYVAFTRARNELCISCRVSVDKKGVESFAGVGADIREAFRLAQTELNSALEADSLCVPLSLEFSENPEEARYSFTLGAPAPKYVEDKGYKEKKDDAAAASDSFEPGVYESVLRTDARELTRVDDVLSRAYLSFEDEPGDHDEDPYLKATGDIESFSNERMRLAAARGTNIHNILALMRHVSDLPVALRAVGSSARLSSEDCDEIERILTEAFEASPQARIWFSEGLKVMSERSIYVPLKDEYYRPDRVVRFPDGRIHVIDYKFTSRHLEEHVPQVRHYRELLKGIYPDAEIKAFLWYPELKILMEV